MKQITRTLLSSALCGGLFFTLVFALGAGMFTNAPQAEAATCLTFTRDLEQGMQGLDVLQMQAYLVEAGFMTQAAYSAGAGTFGPATVTAVKAFQTSVGINPTGYVGPATRQALTNATCSNQQTSTGGGPGNNPSGTPIVIGGLTTNAFVSVRTDRANNTFSQVDSIRVYVTVQNNNVTPLPLIFSTTCQTSFTIGSNFNLNDWRSCPQANSTVNIPVGGSYVWEMTYAPVTFGQLAVGTKTLRATVGNYGSDDITLTITPIQSGQEPINPTVGGGPTNVGGGPTNPTGNTFAIFDAVAGYNGEPSPFLPGLNEMCGGYAPNYFAQNDSAQNYPNEQATRNSIRNLPATCKYYFIDIEHWPTDINKHSAADVTATINKFRQIIGWIRSERPDLKIGIYDMVPTTKYWEPVNFYESLTNNEPWWVAQREPFAQDIQKALQANDFLAPLAQSLDFIAPSIYEPYPNDSLQSWRNFAQFNIEEAKQYGKPVYPFLWYRVNHSAYGYPVLSAARMRQQFDAVKEFGANGFIMWDYGYGAPWQTFDWIPQLQNFITTNNINPTLPASAIDAAGLGQRATFGAYVLAIGFLLIIIAASLLGVTAFKRRIGSRR